MQNGDELMNTARINNELNLTYPDGFTEMSEEELARYFSTPQNRWGVYNAAEHIVLSVSWTKAGFLSFLSDAESVLIGIEGRTRRNLLNYQRVSEYKMNISKNKAYGVRFEYRVNDARIVQVGDLIAFKVKNKYYIINYITRKENAGAAREALKATLDSISVG
jgi:hypothetical protein